MLDLSARSTFYRDLGSLLEAGLLPDQALEHAGRTASHRIGAAALQSSATRVRAGAPLAEALDLGRVRIPAAERAGLAAAERGGDLPRVLDRLADRLDERARALRELAARTAYPLLVLHVAALAFSTPALASGTGSFVAQWVLLTLALDGGLVGLALLVRWRLAASISPDRWPVLGRLFRLGHQGQYLEMLSLLYGSGVPVVESHALAATAVSREPVRRALLRAEPGLRTGHQRLGPSLASTGVMDPLVLGMLSTGEDTGGLEAAAVRAATLIREEERRLLRRTTALAGGLLYAVAVAVVVVVVVRFYSSQMGALR